MDNNGGTSPNTVSLTCTSTWWGIITPRKNTPHRLSAHSECCSKNKESQWCKKRNDIYINIAVGRDGCGRRCSRGSSDLVAWGWVTHMPSTPMTCNYADPPAKLHVTTRRFFQSLLLRSLSVCSVISLCLWRNIFTSGAPSRTKVIQFWAITGVNKL